MLNGATHFKHGSFILSGVFVAFPQSRNQKKFVFPPIGWWNKVKAKSVVVRDVWGGLSWLSVTEQLCGWGGSSYKLSQYDDVTHKPPHALKSPRHFLTLVDKLDVFLVCRSERLFLVVICWCSQSRGMVLFTVRTVENYLGCRKTDDIRGKKETCHRSLVISANAARCSYSSAQRFLVYVSIKRVQLSGSQRLQQLNEGTCATTPSHKVTRSHTHTKAHKHQRAFGNRSESGFNH